MGLPPHLRTCCRPDRRKRPHRRLCPRPTPLRTSARSRRSCGRACSRPSPHAWPSSAIVRWGVGQREGARSWRAPFALVAAPLAVVEVAVFTLVHAAPVPHVAHALPCQPHATIP
eukprot:scaffold3440_cov316-Prasinococcus_capsulatus_cf.AAC.2